MKPRLEIMDLLALIWAVGAFAGGNANEWPVG